MKLPFALLLVLSFLTSVSEAQTEATIDSPQAATIDLLQKIGPPGIGVFAITDAGPFSRHWSRVTAVEAADGSVTSITNSYVELGSGLNRLDQSGNWVAAQASFRVVNGAAIADTTAHTVILTSPTDALPVDLQTPDGKRLSSRVLGISYYSRTTGKSVMIAEPTQTFGKLDNERVTYPDCFDGGFKATLRYTLSLAGLEQDLILDEQPPQPTEFGFGPEEDVVIQLLTEFLQAPLPSITEITVRPQSADVKGAIGIDNSVTDQHLSFGTMDIGAGKSFDLGAPSEAIGPAVTKHFEVIDGRKLLFEELSLTEAAPLILDLPVHVQAGLEVNLRSNLVANRRELLHQLSNHEPAPAEVLVASSTIKMGKGLCLDYSVLQSLPNFTFQGDTTYYLSNSLLSLSGTTVLEGGTVVKASPYNSSFDRKIVISGPLVCKTSSYRPAIFTARDDDTVGETLSDSTHTPSGYYIDWLQFMGTSPIALSNVRIRHAQIGTSMWNSTNYSVTDSQYVNCYIGVESAYGGAWVRNVLIQNAGIGLNTAYGTSVVGENLTADNVTLLNNINGGSTNHFYLTNCLSTAVASTNTYSGTNNIFLSSSTGVFASVASGNYYLAAGSPYRNSASTNISPVLLASLKLKTTYPPLLTTNNIPLPTIWSPQILRDVDTPDYGYHYDPLDYVLSNVTVTSTLILTNGVAIGTFGDVGIKLGDGGILISEGTPLRPNRLGHVNRVQEQESLAGGSIYYRWLDCVPITSLRPEIHLFHSDFSTLSGSAINRYLFTALASYLPSVIEIVHCYLRGAYENVAAVTGGILTLTLRNNLMERNFWTFYQDGVDWKTFTINQYNNLVYGGTFQYYFNVSGSTWIVNDNLFCPESLSGSGTGFAPNHNGYASGLSLMSGETSAKSNLSLDFQSGPMTSWLGYLGSYYYPTSGTSTSLTNLINTGSRIASIAGLYHYTTAVNQSKEAGTTVDIGFHYIALDGSGNLDDFDLDELADYSEDRNGNGTFDTGETDWLNSNSSLAGPAGLQVFTPLK